jgi:hypothetical protein
VGLTVRHRAAAWLAAGLALVLTAAVHAGEPEVRGPAVAGRFYPADPVQLRGAVTAFLEEAVPATGPRPLALVAPHAGYVFSGQIAADAWHQAHGHGYDVIVVLGTNHGAPLAGVSVHGGRAYRTPLGAVAIDRALADRLAAADERFAYRPAVHDGEHSIEVQLPFLQVLFPETPIVPAVVGVHDPALAERFGRLLGRALRGRRPLIVASSDLSHYPAAEDARETDLAVARAIATGDPAAVRAEIRRQRGRNVDGLETCACGQGAVLAALAAARELGARGGHLVSYAHSGDTALGRPDRVVGYAAIALPGAASAATWEAVTAPGSDEPLDADTRAALLGFARTSLRRWFATGTVPLARHLPEAAWRRQGAFVTLKKNGRLRGCIGHLAADRPLAQVVGAMALQAALNDQRFDPLAPGELDEIELEVSALTPLRRVTDAAAIKIGRHGVRLEHRGRAAVFLPQVAPEQGWSRAEMLTRLCRKAGLDPACWRRGAELWTFEAEVFADGGAADPAAE